MFSSSTAFKPYDCSPDWGYFPRSLIQKGSPYENAQIYMGGYYAYKKESCWNIVSYIPILNIFIGVLRLYEAITWEPTDEYRTLRKLQLLRGIFDICLGPINAIVDLVITIARIRIANSYLQHKKDFIT